MQWKPTPVAKVYEALGAVADGRVSVSGESATVLSSSRGKTYTVVYDAESKTVTADDDASYWQGYMGYPIIAFLLAHGVISYTPAIARTLRDIPWKDLNVANKNDFDKTAAQTRKIAKERGCDLAELDAELAAIMAKLKGLKLKKLEAGQRPPSGY